MSNILKQNTENIHVKLQFNDEFRRFFIPSDIPLKFTDLQTKIKDLLHITDSEILIKYKDEEDEWITISSDIELETGLLVTGTGIFRLFCEIKDNNPQQPLQNSNCNTIINDEPSERGNWKKYREKNRGGYKGKGNNNKWKKNYQEKRFRENQNSEMTQMNNSEMINSELTPMPNSELTPINTADDDKNWKERKQQFKREKRERKNKGSKKDRRRKRDDKEEKDDTTSSSESNSDVALLTLEEIKKEIDKLKEEEKILKEKARGAKENLQAVQNLIKEKRKDEKVQPDEILNLREDLNGKKKIKKSIQEELNNTRARIRKLREAAETKQV